MKKFGIMLLLSLMLLSLNGCVMRVGLKQPIAFTASSSTATLIPIHLGVVLPDGTENYTLKKKGFELLVGEAVKQNIGNSLKIIIPNVSVSTNLVALPKNIDKIAYVRFGSESQFYIPLTIFQEVQLSVALDFEVCDKSNTLIWKTSSVGTSKGNSPPTIGILTAGLIESFYRNLTRDAVKAALDDLNKQIIAEGIFK